MEAPTVGIRDDACGPVPRTRLLFTVALEVFGRERGSVSETKPHTILRIAQLKRGAKRKKSTARTYRRGLAYAEVERGGTTALLVRRTEGRGEYGSVNRICLCSETHKDLQKTHD